MLLALCAFQQRDGDGPKIPDADISLSADFLVQGGRAIAVGDGAGHGPSRGESRGSDLGKSLSLPLTFIIILVSDTGAVSTGLPVFLGRRGHHP